jgi:uncharacterized iron-regulated membrane protein
MAASRTLLMKTALGAFPGLMSLIIIIAAVTGSLLFAPHSKANFLFVFVQPARLGSPSLTRMR